MKSLALTFSVFCNKAAFIICTGSIFLKFTIQAFFFSRKFFIIWGTFSNSSLVFLIFWFSLKKSEEEEVSLVLSSSVFIYVLFILFESIVSLIFISLIFSIPGP